MTTDLRRRLSVPAKHLGLILIGFVMLYPVLWMIVSSLRPNTHRNIRQPRRASSRWNTCAIS